MRDHIASLAVQLEGVADFWVLTTEVARGGGGAHCAGYRKVCSTIRRGVGNMHFLALSDSDIVRAFPHVQCS